MNTIPDDLPTGRYSVELNSQRAPEAGDTIDISLLLAAIRRQALLVTVCVVLGAVAAIIYALSLQPLYTSHATILLDEERAELLDLISAVPSAALRDGSVESEMEILKSQTLAERVVETVGLTERPGAIAQEPTPIGVAIGAVEGVVRTILSPFMASPDQPAEPAGEADPRAPVRTLATRVRQRLDVSRVGRSYVLQLSYTAPDPALATEIASAYTDAYLTLPLELNSAAADSAMDWLRERVETLRDQSLAASRTLEDFRQANNLVSVGARLLSQQEISEISSQIVLAEADASRAKARADQLDTALSEGGEVALASLGTVEGGEPSTSLAARYARALSERRAMVERFGEDQPGLAALDREIADLDADVAAELTRRATEARNAWQAELSRVTSLREGLARAMGVSATDADALYQLRQLEQTEESYKQLYQSALKQLEQVAQQRSLPITAARIITAPETPRGQSSPQKAIYAALGIVLGGLLGAAAGTLREVSRDRLASPADVTRSLQLPVIATLPRTEAAELAAPSGAAPDGAALTKGLLALKIAVDRHGPGSRPRTLAVVSTHERDRGAAVAEGFAALLADAGYKVLLLDARDVGMEEHTVAAEAPTLLSLADAGARPSLTEVDADPSGRLHALRLSDPDLWTTAMLRAGSAQMRSAFHALTTGADYAILLCPYASEGGDCGAFADYAELAVLVADTRSAKATSAQRLMAATPRGTLLGVLLTRS